MRRKIRYTSQGKGKETTGGKREDSNISGPNGGT